MPGRSPSRRNSPPPPPRISQRSPAFRPRGRSPERRRRMDGPGPSRGMSPPRGREHREFQPSPRSHPPEFVMPRRSRSPLRESKRRSLSPRRKMSPKRERERERRPGMGRKRSRSKTPPLAGPSREGPRMIPYSGSLSPPPSRSYQGPSDSYGAGIPVLDVPHRPIGSLGDRFRATNAAASYDETRRSSSERPVFRGPEGSGFDINELKKITVDIRRNLPMNKGPAVERNIINPENVVVVRRPDMMTEEGYAAQPMASRGRYIEENRPSNPSRRKGSSWERQAASQYDKSEGSRPIFDRDEIIEGNERMKYEPGPSDEHHRVVAIVDHPPPHQSSGGPRFDSPGRYPGPSAGPSHSRDPYYERDYRPREYERNHGPPEFESREKIRDERFDRRDDLRHDLELRRRDDNRYSGHGDRSYEKGHDYRGDSDRGSNDLRRRINEKRTDRHEDRSPGRHHMMDRREPMERDRSRDRRMMQPSPPGDRRRGPPPPMEEFHPRPEPPHHKMRGEGRRMPPPQMVHHGPGGPGRRDDGFHPEHPPEFGGHQRQERFHPPNKPWEGEPEFVPKGRPYFEHDNREDMRMPNRGRGMMVPRGVPRGRGMMRGRPFRGAGPTRFMRGVGRRGGYSPRKSSPEPEDGFRGNKFGR